MKISNARIFLNGAFVEGGLEFDTDVTAAGPNVSGGVDAEGCYLIPGLVDVHTHGALGEDADFVLLDRSWNVRAVYIDGIPI